MTADDVLQAVDELELGGKYKDELLQTLNTYRASQQAKTAAKKKKKDVPPNPA
jgi:hypothetical protein